MNKKILVKGITSIAMGLVALILCIAWYDWKLFAIIFIALWGSNVGQSDD